ncbi:MAG TPA: hypothetical protein VD948_04910 [Rhodothermales bacterium]|nr:hypothetical protein [Rhodothermales bacterium]
MADFAGFLASSITVAPGASEAVRNAARVLAGSASVSESDASGGLRVGTGDGYGPQRGERPQAWAWAKIDAQGNGEVSASDVALLYAFAHQLATGGLTEDQRAALTDGLLVEPAFTMHRPLFDYTLTQSARTVRDFDPERYVETLARSGFTHVEVNGLAAPLAFEPGVPTEYYDEFYTYCPALSQFVDSPLTRGVYPHEYLAANLNRLKKLAALGRKYGLKPGLCCFEPRTLPEFFFQRYPTLRGARVDHPFRSHLPRYTLAQDHPASQEHYRTMVQNLVREVPDLAYMSVWTNDSGAGFEHTASLYVGRNGGPYLIREWRNHDKIAEAAAQSALRWLRLVQEAAAEVNPDFEVILRLEPFKVEHDTFVKGMGDGLSFEAPSLLVRGYHLPYNHPHYPEQQSVAGSIFHDAFDDEEKERLAHYRAAGVEPKMTYAPGTAFNAEPLLGIPFPRLLHRKLAAMRDLGIRHVNAMGGLLHPEKTPFWPHVDVLRAATVNPDLSIDAILQNAAERYAGAAHAVDLVRLWDDVEAAVERMPMVPLYSHFGFVWLRTWVRPLVPDIEAIPREDRLYYERYLVSTFNNPNINDLGRDVLFELISEEAGRSMTKGFDENVLPRLDAARQEAERLVAAADAQARPVFEDLVARIRALRVWATTQRNTCAWVAGVYGYLGTDDEAARAGFRADLDHMIDLDLANTRELLDLWETSPVEFIIVSDVGETSFIYGENLGDLLRRKLELTAQYRHHAPRIDRDIMWRLTPQG